MKALAVSSLLILLSLPANAQIAVGGSRQGQRQDSQNINNTEFNGVKQKNVAGARAYVPHTTSDCMGSSGGAAQSPYFGVSLSSTHNARPCNMRENAKLIGLAGNVELSERIIISLVCEDSKMKKVLPECGLSEPKNDACEYPTKPECKQSKRFK